MGILRDLAIILLVIEAAIGALVAITLLGALLFVLYRCRWWQILPRWLLAGRSYLALGQQAVERVSRRAADPVFTVASAASALKAFLSRR